MGELYGTAEMRVRSADTHLTFDTDGHGVAVLNRAETEALRDALTAWLAGPTDEQVAREVMGWAPERVVNYTPTTNDTQAREALERVTGSGGEWGLHAHPAGGYYAAYGGPPASGETATATQPTAALAMCVAALEIARSRS